MNNLLDKFKNAVTLAWAHTPDEDYLTRKELEVAVRAFVFILGKEVLGRKEYNELIKHYESLKND